MCLLSPHAHNDKGYYKYDYKLHSVKVTRTTSQVKFPCAAAAAGRWQPRQAAAQRGTPTRTTVVEELPLLSSLFYLLTPSLASPSCDECHIDITPYTLYLVVMESPLITFTVSSNLFHEWESRILNEMRYDESSDTTHPLTVKWRNRRTTCVETTQFVLWGMLAECNWWINAGEYGWAGKDQIRVMKKFMEKMETVLAKC